MEDGQLIDRILMMGQVVEMTGIKIVMEMFYGNWIFEI